MKRYYVILNGKIVAKFHCYRAAYLYQMVFCHNLFSWVAIFDNKLNETVYEWIY